MFGIELNILSVAGIGLIGWAFAVFMYSKFTKAQKDRYKLTQQKESLRGMISKEISDKYKGEISELKRYQTQYLVHMEERDKILSSLSTLIREK